MTQRRPKRTDPLTVRKTIGNRRLEELIEEAVADAFGESEQRVGFLTMLIPTDGTMNLQHERVPVLRVSGRRSATHRARDRRATPLFHARYHHLHAIREPLRVG